MFDKLLREMEKMKRMEIFVPIKADEEGYLDKECPSDNCLFQFKVFEEDWSKKSKEDSAFCPLCGQLRSNKKLTRNE